MIPMLGCQDSLESTYGPVVHCFLLDYISFIPFFQTKPICMISNKRKFGEIRQRTKLPLPSFQCAIIIQVGAMRDISSPQYVRFVESASIP